MKINRNVKCISLPIFFVILWNMDGILAITFPFREFRKKHHSPFRLLFFLLQPNGTLFDVRFTRNLILSVFLKKCPMLYSRVFLFLKGVYPYFLLFPLNVVVIHDVSKSSFA